MIIWNLVYYVHVCFANITFVCNMQKADYPWMTYCWQYEALTIPGEELSQLVADVGLLFQVVAVLRLVLCFLELWGGQSHNKGIYRTSI